MVDDYDDVVQRAPSGVPGMDELIQGGYPRGGIHIVSGPPGSGKSLIGIQFLMEGAKAGETGIYLSLDETEGSIRKAMRGFGIGKGENEALQKLIIFDMTQARDNFLAPEFDTPIMDFKPMTDFMLNVVRVNSATRVVIDSIVAIGLPYERLQSFRQDLFVFCRKLRDENVTSVLITESDDEAGVLTRYKTEGFVGDSFISMGLQNIKGELVRSITVRKMRYTDHDTAQHPLFIGKGGMTVKSDAGIF